VRVIKSQSPIGSWQPDSDSRSDINLKRSSRCISESIGRVRRVCEDSKAKTWNLPPIEPPLGFERHRLYVSAERRAIDHSFVQQRMGAEQPRSRASVPGAWPDRQRRLRGREIGTPLGDDCERCRFH
jgi:hypothetical protein